MRLSMDSSKDNGGDLGWFTPDKMVKPFSEAVLSLKPGEYTHKPIQTQYGWHVIELVETRENPSIEQVFTLPVTWRFVRIELVESEHVAEATDIFLCHFVHAFFGEA